DPPARSREAPSRSADRVAARASRRGRRDAQGALARVGAARVAAAREQRSRVGREAVRVFALVLALGVLSSCASNRHMTTCLATARVTPDFKSYVIQRVGLIPLAGRSLEVEQREFLQDALAS